MPNSIRKSERVTDSMIIEHVRRFGPLNTSQLYDKFGLSSRARLRERLFQIPGITCVRQEGRQHVWSADH